MSIVRSRAVPAREALAAYRERLSPTERVEYDVMVERGWRKTKIAIGVQEETPLHGESEE